ncbi:hypothetical protein [Limimaricola sp. AA108-03]|uniref:hypothetical protein n=1 Tax=Limimaricola sp. AA108-03 TaxID=3425945 RepID=UPI003D778C95
MSILFYGMGLSDELQPRRRSAKRRLGLHAGRGSGGAPGGHGRAEPEVGNLWRSEIALAEAVASAGLEGIRISEGDLLPRIAQNGSQDADPTGAELALSLIRVLKAPSDPLAQPVQTVRRFERAAGTGMGPGIVPGDEPEGQLLEDAEMRDTAHSRSRDQRAASAQEMRQAISELDAAPDQVNILLIDRRRRTSN